MSTLLIILSIIVSAAAGMAAGYAIFGHNSKKSLISDIKQTDHDNPQKKTTNDSSNSNTDESVSNESSGSNEMTELKEKLKELEDKNKTLIEDLEDLEDELSSQNRKLRQEKEKLYSEKEAHQDTRNKLECSEKENQNLKSSSKLKAQSLLFVLEIINAKRTSDSTITNLYEKLNTLKSFIAGELKETIKNIFGLDETNKKLFGPNLERWIITEKKTWIKGKTTIAFVGEFSAGKTSIVNRILSMDNPDIPRLPVSTKATTAIPTYISGGSDTYYQFVTPNNELKELSESTFKTLKKEILDQLVQSDQSTSNEGISSLIKYLVMTYNNPNLDKLSILDTPGFSSNDKQDTKHTIDVINECDALFWVMDVNAGTINHSSIDLIKKHLNKPLYIVINKIDTKAPFEVDNVENHICNTLSDEGIKVQEYIRFSDKAPLNTILKAITAITHYEDEDYITILSDKLTEYIKIVAKRSSKANKSVLQLFNQNEEEIEQYTDIVLQSIQNCQDSILLPQENSRFNFMSDDYGLSKEQYYEMTSLLQDVHDNMNKLLELYDQSKITNDALTDALNEKEITKLQLNQLKENKKQLNKYINEIRSLTH